MSRKVNRNGGEKLVDRLLRRLVPSVAALSHRRGLMSAFDLADAVVSLPFPRFRRLPPNRLRLRVGVGNRVFFNQAQFLAYGERTWRAILDEGLADAQSALVDIGCGCGRTARALPELGFAGRYLGIDVDREMIDWCQRHLASAHMRFEHADVRNSVYNPDGKAGFYRLPVADGTQDLVFSQSLFTHLLPDELAHYVRESFRALKPGRAMRMAVFCLDDMRDAGILGGRWTFAQRIGDAHVESLELPEAAVAYDREFLVATCRAAGFASAEVVPGQPQGNLIGRR